MTDFRAEVRKAQAKALAEKPELLEITDRLYNSIDTLNEGQLQVLIEGSLKNITAVAEALTSEPVDLGYGKSLIRSFVATAGYASLCLQEKLGNTATGDRCVDEILEASQDVVKSAVMTMFSPKLQEANAKIEARIKAGDDAEAVYREELAAIGIDYDNDAPTAKEETTDEVHGMYL